MATTTTTDARVAEPQHDAPGEEHLTTGWESMTPLSDSLVHRSVHAYAASLWRPVAALGGHVRRAPRVVVHDLRQPVGRDEPAAVLLGAGGASFLYDAERRRVQQAVRAVTERLGAPAAERLRQQGAHMEAAALLAVAHEASADPATG